MAREYLETASAQGFEAAEQALQGLILTDEFRDKTLVNSPPRDVEAPSLEGSSLLAMNTYESPIRDEAWILSQNPDHYTIQVIGLSNSEKLEALVDGHENLAPFAIYSVQRSTRPIRVLIQGSYADVDSARAARDVFPREINPPDQVWIRQFGKIQELIAAAKGE
jgi:DamX protein